MDQKERLERLVWGLEISIPDMESRLSFYKEGDLESLYARKQLEAMRQQLEGSKKELEELNRKASA